MRRIRDIYTEHSDARTPVISFEFFPPKTAEGEAMFLSKTLPLLAALKPDYCSVTYGAGGSTRGKTFSIVDQIQRDFGLTALAHLTCVGSTRAEIGEIAKEASLLGIGNILALRGDPPVGMNEFVAPAGGFTYAHELVTFLRAQGDFCLGVAGFPEGHVACKAGREADWRHLKAKIDCGADFVITQLFFDNRHYFEFREHLRGLGVTVPLVPGIIPVLNAGQVQKFTAMCGASVPGPLLERLERFGDDEVGAAQYGIDYASAQCAELLQNGVPGLHFYTLNKARSTSQILQQLGLAREKGV